MEQTISVNKVESPNYYRGMSPYQMGMEIEILRTEVDHLYELVGKLTKEKS